MTGATFVSRLLVAGMAVVTAISACHASTVSGHGTCVPEGYCPPLISNGDLNMLVDWWGGQGTNEYYSLNTEIYWQGRRSVAREARLFGFGRFNPMLSIDGKDAGLPLDWSQTLDVTNAFVETIGSYAGVESATRVFCALHRNVIGVRRTFRSTDGTRHRIAADLDYSIASHDRLAGKWHSDGVMRRYAGRTYGHRVIDFTVSIVAADGGGARICRKRALTGSLPNIPAVGAPIMEKRSCVCRTHGYSACTTWRNTIFVAMPDAGGSRSGFSRITGRENTLGSMRPTCMTDLSHLGILT